MSDSGTKVNAVFLATIMVLSVVSMSGLFVGSAGGASTAILNSNSDIILDSNQENNDTKHQLHFELDASGNTLQDRSILSL